MIDGEIGHALRRSVKNFSAACLSSETHSSTPAGALKGAAVFTLTCCSTIALGEAWVQAASGRSSGTHTTV